MTGKTDNQQQQQQRPRLAVHKFTSCDGCQLAFLNLGEPLLELAGLVDIVHFPEAGPVDPEAQVDVAFVEGSISTSDEIERIRTVRRNTRFLITIGACATSGGLQALRNVGDGDAWLREIYPEPEHLRSLAHSEPIAAHARVDLELWGCPVNGRQVVAAIKALLYGVKPVEEHDKVCMECKRRQVVCVMVSKGIPCMGPVTLTGCGALCPAFGRDCYACYGPAEQSNTPALAHRLSGMGLLPADIYRRFSSIQNGAAAFRQTAAQYRDNADDDG
jgi:coenzyme F420-reducing hydrogenase gamma subunit